MLTLKIRFLCLECQWGQALPAFTDMHGCVSSLLALHS